jgi:hypothetical protein
MLAKERVAQGFPKSYNKAYFDLIDVFMHKNHALILHINETS